MADDGERLSRRCTAAGILTAYHDIWGKEHRASDESLVALLRELDDGERDGRHATDGDAGSAAAGDRHQAHRPASSAHPILPPVLAVRADDSRWFVPMSHVGSGSTVSWSITEEAGTVHRGVARVVTADAQTPSSHFACGLSLPAGYHHLSVDGHDGTSLVVAAPAHGYRPPPLADGARLWGPAVQLYGVRSRRNWGMGDLGDLCTLISQWAAHGASLVGLNPLHALFPHNPWHISPYSPSSRLMLNTLYLDVEGVDDYAECDEVRAWVSTPAFQDRLEGLRASQHVDYAGVSAAKHAVLRRLHAHFVAVHLANDTPRARSFRAFVSSSGDALRQHATFEALQARFHAADASVWGWPLWPAEFRDPGGPAVREFQSTHTDDIGYYAWLQWLVDRQVAAAQNLCTALGMEVGLYLDLAVSVDRAGSDAWAHADLYASGATVGAPPDEVNPNGQGWGLPPLRPDRLRESRYKLFIDTLRASMRHAGALRIDHVMGLMRLYWIPPAHTARDGAYVLYPLEELMAIVTLESQRNACMVIGEDLGTVDEAMREAMAQSEMLSYKLLYFERTADGAFQRGDAYPRHSLVAISTHDLPTLAGWWSGHDLDVRKELGQYATPDLHAAQMQARRDDRLQLLQALQQAKLLPQSADLAQLAASPLTPALSEAVHAYVAGAASEVMLLQLEDALDLRDQANLPGTIDEHPNWRRKLPLDLETQAGDETLRTLARRLADIRPRPLPRRESGVGPEARIPRATYRLQFHRGFGFDDAIRILPYLQRLGISHVYCSPILRARAGSTHGYDVVAHDEVNPELGGRAAFERFCAALQAHDMGQILDMVPNHMGVLGSDNAWWTDLLEHGPASAWSGYFDVDWDPVNPELKDKVLVPVLGEPYGTLLDRGELRVVFERGSGTCTLRYHEHRFPLDPRSYADVLDGVPACLDDSTLRAQLDELSKAFARLPPTSTREPEARAARHRQQAILKTRLAALVHDHAPLADALRARLDGLNGDASRNTLHALLERQAFRLAHWRVAADEINYRRFFDINELAALRMEAPEVFEDTQRFALELTASGTVDGLRIDHPDGLRDPAAYFERLQTGHARRAGLPIDATASRPLYVVAEKIAAPHEDVPPEWQVHGTTGYRFAMVANGVLVDTDSADAFEAIWQDHGGEPDAFETLAVDGKAAVARGALASELTALATALLRIARAERHTRDYTYNSLRDTLADIVACMPVYRTYVVDLPSTQDDRYLDWAMAHARRRSTLADLSVFDFARDCMRNTHVGDGSATTRQRVRDFAHRFQQFSAPVAAKGVEDTAFYRYHRLVSLNEVGGDPSVFGITPRAFHGASADRATRWPHTMVGTSTHDNKRSEDVRTRLDVLSEMPEAWAAGLLRWRDAVAVQLDARTELPSTADQYLFYQTVLGTLPAEGLDDAGIATYRERISAYMLKAAREGKRHTSWTRPDEAYEQRLTAMVNGVLARVKPNPLLRDLQSLAETLAWFGAFNSTSLALLKYTAPGVPDTYQGTEVLDLSLVDPDNRRPVDFDLRTRMLDHLDALRSRADLPSQLASLSANPLDGRLKLWITWRLLQARAADPAFFRGADYQPLTVEGRHAQHVLAYKRTCGPTTLVVVVGRLFARLCGESHRAPLGDEVWGDTRVMLDGEQSDVNLENVLDGTRWPATDAAISVGGAFAHLAAAAFWIRRPD